MIKREELTNPNSCMSRAKDDEMTFVLLGRDICAPHAIREWVRERVACGKNSRTDSQIQEALACAAKMEEQPVAAPYVSRETSAGQPCKFEIGQTVKWQGQVGECRGTIKRITLPENSDYVLWLDIGCDEDFPHGVNDVELAQAHCFKCGSTKPEVRLNPAAHMVTNKIPGWQKEPKVCNDSFHAPTESHFSDIGNIVNWRKDEPEAASLSGEGGERSDKQLLDEFRLMAVRLNKTNDAKTLEFVQQSQAEILRRMAAQGQKDQAGQFNSSFPEMEVKATVALDSGDGGTRRACNNENCLKDYLHKGPCSDGSSTTWECFNGIDVRWDGDAKVFVGKLTIYSQSTSKERAVEAVKSALRLLAQTEWACGVGGSPARSVEARQIQWPGLKRIKEASNRFEHHEINGYNGAVLACKKAYLAALPGSLPSPVPQPDRVILAKQLESSARSFFAEQYGDEPLDLERVEFAARFAACQLTGYKTEEEERDAAK